jgi:NAD(P)-dependent dehydrogenase (short-subunit alcohol dehydrogenase family)
MLALHLESTVDPNSFQRRGARGNRASDHYSSALHSTDLPLQASRICAPLVLAMSPSYQRRSMGIQDGKVALVTGAGRGIGRSIALLLAREGARVVVNDIGCELDGTGYDEKFAEDVVREIEQAGGKALASHHDAASAEGARSAVQTAIDAYGGLDVLVNSAGVARDRTLLKMEEAAWDAVIMGVLKSAFLCTQAAARQMVVQGRGGRIVNMTGLPGYLGGFGQANLAAACAGVHGLTRTSSIELQKHRITVNAVAPLAATRMTEGLPLLDGFDNVTTDHVAPIVLMLCSDLCAERTGHVVAVAGARVHALRFVESAGKFKDESAGVFTAQEVDEYWAAINRV